MTDKKIKTIAFYLPQFHPIPENDMWWGKGFTEWTNVVKAVPQFKDHYQPRVPADLGYYDLRDDEVRRNQAELARSHGLYGFCYYYYWFNGKKLLDLPMRRLLENGKPDFPFCICYANENWTRRWDGKSNEILMEQRYSHESDKALISELLPVFKDKRYIRVNNRPLLLVYRADLFPSISDTIRLWRREAKKEGLEDLYLCKCEVFGDFKDPQKNGFDANVEFPPNNLIIRPKKKLHHIVRRFNPSFKGLVYDYREAAVQSAKRPWPKNKLFRTVMLGWDNTARRGESATIFHNFSMEYYEKWLANVMRKTADRYPEEERLVFINAWNEWAEGTYLEPDQKYGLEYLKAVERAIDAVNSGKEIGDFGGEVGAHKVVMWKLTHRIKEFLE